MFYVTGDVHADIEGFKKRGFQGIRQKDCIVICGDFGLIWNGSEQERKIARSLGRKRYKTLFIDGTHENFSLLESCPVTEWCGGKVQVISQNLIHLMRGQVYLINDKRIFTFGGGESVEKEMRVAEKTWWAQEAPSRAEMEEGVENLEACGWQVDYIFTHEAPASLCRLFDSDFEEPNVLNVYLDQINKRCTFKKWVFGSYHRTKQMTGQHNVVFEGVLKLD
ncbi:MAG: hypothetical protein P4L75_03630 [Clostridia bacterium]|nr:hypothetical protein [Clostridia bacterium]MDR3644878.1 hypothetical protein [Clostridia bacterium]